MDLMPKFRHPQICRKSRIKVPSLSDFTQKFIATNSGRVETDFMHVRQRGNVAYESRI